MFEIRDYSAIQVIEDLTTCGAFTMHSMQVQAMSPALHLSHLTLKEHIKSTDTDSSSDFSYFSLYSIEFNIFSKVFSLENYSNDFISFS